MDLLVLENDAKFGVTIDAALDGTAVSRVQDLSLIHI